MGWEKIGDYWVAVAAGVTLTAFGATWVCLQKNFPTWKLSVGEWLSARPWAVALFTSLPTAAVTAALILCISAISGANNPVPAKQADFIAFETRTGDQEFADLNDLRGTQAGLSSLRDGLLTWSTDLAAAGNAVGGGDQKPAAMCPNDTYAIGVNLWGAPGSTRYCIGCVQGIQLICKKLNAK